MRSYAQVDVEKPDLARFPALARARGLEALLRPGDCLWMPSYVWHYVRQLEPGSECISLSFGFDRDAPRGALLRSPSPPSFDDVIAAAIASESCVAIGKVNSESHLAATGLRFELMGLLDAEAAKMLAEQTMERECVYALAPLEAVGGAAEGASDVERAKNQ